MDVYVYADLLFLINAGMDGLCLMLTGKLTHRRISWWRLLIASLTGGVYAVLSLVLQVPAPVSLLMDVGVCLLMCAVAFCGQKVGGIQRYSLSVLLYFLLSMGLGGIMTALYSLWNRLGVDALLPHEQEGLGTWLFTLFSILGGVITLWSGRLFRRLQKVQECTVTICAFGKTISLIGLVDTGNMLRDPLGGKAVICAESDKLRPILPSALVAMGEETNAIPNYIQASDIGRIRLIPTSTATGGKLVTGFLPDRVTLEYASDGKVQKREVDAVIGMVGHLTHTEALVPSDLIE